MKTKGKEMYSPSGENGKRVKGPLQQQQKKILALTRLAKQFQLVFY